MIVVAHNEIRRYESLLKRIKIIVFMGTPHRGSSIADFAGGVARLSNLGARSTPFFPVWGVTRHELIRVLRSQSDELDKLSRSFAALSEHISIIAAYENESHPLLDRPVGLL